MFRVADHAGPGRGQRRHHQRSPAPQVRRSQLRAPQHPARPDTQRSSIDLNLRAKTFKTGRAAEPSLKDDIFDAALPLGAEHSRRQQRGRICGKGRVNAREHPPGPIQPPEAGEPDAVAALLHPAPHLFQNFQHRRIEQSRAAAQFGAPARCRHRAGQRGGKNAVRQRRKHAAGKVPPPLDAEGGTSRPLDACTAAVQKCGQVCDLRLPRRTPQHGGASGAGRCQHERLRGPHAGETQGDLCPMQAGRSRQHQPAGACLPLHRPHLAQPGQMQVDGPRPDVAPAGQTRLGTAQLCQQRRTEEDGRPHLFGSLPRKAAVLRGTRDKDILPFPPGRTACAPQKRQARRHIRKARHGPQTHIAAEHRRRKQRQHAVFRRRDAHCTVQRAAAHHHNPVFHKCSPHFAKDTPRYAK